MERDKLIEILENGSEAELTLIQNYLLDRILKNLPNLKEATERAVATSERIKELEQEVARLQGMVAILSAKEDNSKTCGTGTSWTTSTAGYCQDSWSVPTVTTTTATYDASSISSSASSATVSGWITT